MSSTGKQWIGRGVLAMVFAGAPALVAQGTPATTTLVGAVRDSSGRAVANAEVWLRGSDLFTHTNDLGGFRLPGAPVGASKVTFRRLGYEQATVDLALQANRIDSLVISLTSVAANLPGVVVQDEYITRSKRLLAGFWDRRDRGFGHFLARDEIEKKNPQDFTDLVRTMPGVTIQTLNGRRSIRFSRAVTGRGDCPPLYWVDGMRVEGASSDDFPPQDVEALEIYNGTATIPSQFAPKPTAFIKTCGAIVIWTRLPGT